MDGLNSLSVLDNDIQSLAQKVYTGKELDRVCAFYNEHCEAVEKELKVLQILKKKKVNIDLLNQFTVNDIEFIRDRYNEQCFYNLTLEETKLIIEWLKESK